MSIRNDIFPLRFRAGVDAAKRAGVPADELTSIFRNYDAGIYTSQTVNRLMAEATARADTGQRNIVDPFAVLDEVKATLTERGGEYGDATIEDSFPRIRRYWVAFFKNRFNLDVDLTDADVASLMVLMKTARIDANPNHEDSHKDRIGYAAQSAIKAKG